MYRTADGYDTLDRSVPEYEIGVQEWPTMPHAENAGIWTAPNFDGCGGEIWMIARSLPTQDAGGIFAIVTTDLLVAAHGK